MKLYAERNAIELGAFYTDHVMAMTSEGLHSKSDIACELAYRDKIIKKLRDALMLESEYQLGNYGSVADWIGEALGVKS